MSKFTKQKMLKILVVIISILILGFYLNSKLFNGRKNYFSTSNTDKGKTTLIKKESSNKDEQFNKIVEEKPDKQIPKPAASAQKKAVKKTTPTTKESSVNPTTSSKEKNNSVEIYKNAPQNNTLYNDGVYYGNSDGKNGTIDVEVQVSEGKIIRIQVISHNETKNLFDIVYKKITDAVYEKQSPDVDIVTGATLSSTGFINAIKSALEKSLK